MRAIAAKRVQALALLLVIGCWRREPSQPAPPPPPPRPEPRAECPAAFASSGGGPCASLKHCDYPQGHCFCVATCRGGAALEPGVVDPPPQWRCFANPPAVRSDGCPGMPPDDGEACSQAKQCAYAIDTTGACWGLTKACDGNRWVAIPQAPPP